MKEGKEILDRTIGKSITLGLEGKERGKEDCQLAQGGVGTEEGKLEDENYWEVGRGESRGP